MPNDAPQSVSDSLETDPRLLLHMPYLLQDLWSLGSDVDSILTAVDSCRLSPGGAGILDVCCGKGAVSVQIASRFGYRVTGIDAMPEFLRDAEEKAREFNVARLCEFRRQDIFDFVKTGHSFDAAILASLGGIFGTFQETAAVLRRQVREGGYMIIDDGYLKRNKSLERKGYSHYRNHDDTLRELTAHGDTLLLELSTADATERINREYLHLIRKRGNELISRNPELRTALEEYIAQQEEECRIIAEKIAGALWLIQKRGI